jgi:hypothetical protein
MAAINFPSGPVTNDVFTSADKTWTYNGTSWDLVQGTISIADDSVTTSKILDGTIVNSDISASAAISLSKLATSTAGNIIVYNSSGVPTAVAESGDVTISDSGVAAISSGVIVNADVNASAAINSTKITNWENDQIILAQRIFG